MKKTTLRTLAMVLTLVMVLGMLPAGLLSFTAAAATNTIYVAPNGSDTTGDGSEANPYATIQKAVNAVPEDNTVPTTILIADGVYNVYVNMDSANDIKVDDLGHTLIVNKDNVTLKAQNEQKVFLYGYVDDAESAKITLKSNEARYKTLLTVHLENATNVTLDGLVVLPTFFQSKREFVTGDLKGKDLTSFQNYVAELVPGGIADFADKANLYYDGGGNEVVQAGGWSAAGKLYNLTIKNCNIGATVLGGIRLGSKLLGEYHIENNTVKSINVFQKAGNEAENPCTITGNTFAAGMTITGTKDDYNNPPVIRGNTFTALAGTRYFDSVEGLASHDLKQTYVIRGISDEGNSPFTDGEWSVIAKANTFKSYGATLTMALTHVTTYFDATNKKAYVDTLLGPVNGFTNTGSNAYEAPVEDVVLDTEEELAYLLTQEGDLTLTQNIVVTQDILPQEITANLIFGEFSVTKDAALDIDAPNGYTWFNGTTLIVHTHVPTTEWNSNGEYHWYVCSIEGCPAKLEKAAHVLTADDHDCTTAEVCTVCQREPNPAQAYHVYSSDCTKAGVCLNPGCEQKGASATFHTFTDGNDTKCNVPGCTYTREPIDGKIIYVATTGSDETGTGSWAKPYATIQAAVNEVPEENTEPITILIADGAYNVFVAAGSENSLSSSKNHGLSIAKSNLTLKAQNKQKVVIYGYTEAATSLHDDHSVMRIRNSQSLTFDGLVILPLFAQSMSASSSKPTVEAASVNDLLRSFLGEDLADQVVGDASGKVYYSTARAMIVTNKWGIAPSNGDVNSTSGLTFKDCYLDCLSNGYGAIKVQVSSGEGDTFTGDYHFIGNTIVGGLTIDGAGNDTTVQSEIRNNIIISTSTSGSSKQIKISGAVEKLPVIEGNVFKCATVNIGDGQDVIVNSSTAAQYTTGQLAVMALTNSVANTNMYCNLYNPADSQKITITSKDPDTTIDTEEELAYWLTQEGEVVLAANIKLTKALPEDMPGTLVRGSYNVAKDADLVTLAPEGYAWKDGTSLKTHTHAPAAEWLNDGEYHWHACTTDDCLAKVDKAAHFPAADDYDCTTADTCGACGQVCSTPKAAHEYDSDCTTDDECMNDGCRVKTTKFEAHTFTDSHDTTCDVPGCIGTQKQTHTAGAEWLVDGEQHYHPCTYEGCEEKVDAATHVAAEYDDCTSSVYCTVCQTKISDGAAAHTFDNSHDTTCNVPGCTGTQVESHEWSVSWMSDETSHWRVCASCDAKAEEGAHTGTAVCNARAYCETCNAPFGDVDPNNHSISDYWSNGDATCEQDGTKSAMCEYGCGWEDTIVDEGSKLGHKFTKYTSNNDATCEQDGTKTASCDNGCGKKNTVTEEGTKLGHKFNKYTANNDATCEQDATETATCANGCGTTDTIIVEGTAKGHNYERKAWESDKDNHWKSCDCGEKFNVAAHTGKLVGAVDATEEAEGYTGDTVCEDCGYEIAKGEAIPMLEKPVNVVVIVIIIVVAVAAIGVGAFLVISKKKKQQL